MLFFDIIGCQFHHFSLPMHKWSHKCKCKCKCTLQAQHSTNQNADTNAHTHAHVLLLCVRFVAVANAHQAHHTNASH